MTNVAQHALRFLFDPACPWAWRAALWIRVTARLRPLSITWELLSLTELNRERLDAAGLERAQRRQPALRLLQAAGMQHGNAALDRLYAALGQAVHAARCSLEQRATLADALRAAELPEALLAACDDTTLDQRIVARARQAMAEGAFGVPTLYLADQSAPFFGPVLDPAPTGEVAGQLWDHLVALASTPGFYELKRARS
ncbi:DsbA family protein [Kallotenue papyrolyticum]|uniref:mycothiol-dependent nitroreductase Rv2466c family protein n=1 Tax=Kallotenue papyrolyticum TaxID=1325125 RepID=UPI000492C2A8|nr:DsbA family protein [Kallotenue papyrolyticum]